jgi:tyrosyl-tRNA synthetase
LSGNVYDELKERGFIAQVSDENAVRKMLGEKQVTFYIGFDSTAASLHAGTLVPIMAMVHLRRAGHHALAVVGGGTTMVGDPSGKTEMRQMLDESTIRASGRSIHAQLDRYLHFDGQGAVAVDNADWLLPLNYVTFLREIGRHFSVNRMLAAEAYKQRLEKGLSFIEFNYQLLQAYDYLHLFREFGCTLQMGGDDQWGNILAGVDLIRRIDEAAVEAMTFPLLTTSSGAKMGKTAQGAVWLDPALFSPYDFYQYWVNCDDRDVGRFLRMYTLVPLDEIRRLEKLKDSEINEAKRLLAFEATKLAHGDRKSVV